MPDAEWVTIAEFARQKQVTTRTVERWCARQLLERRRIFGRRGVLVRQRSIDEITRLQDAARPRRVTTNEYGEVLALPE